MTSRFVQNRIQELKNTSSSLLMESQDPDSKGNPMREAVKEANRQLSEVVNVLTEIWDHLKEEESRIS